MKIGEPLWEGYAEPQGLNSCCGSQARAQVGDVIPRAGEAPYKSGEQDGEDEPAPPKRSHRDGRDVRDPTARKAYPDLGREDDQANHLSDGLNPRLLAMELTRLLISRL